MANNYTLSQDSKQKLEILAKEINIIKRAQRLGTSSLTPLNYNEEMEKFFKVRNYNPQYIYNKSTLPDYTKELDKLKIKVDGLFLPDDLKQHILEFLDDQKKLYLTKISIGKSNFSENAHNLFDWGSDRLDLLLARTPNVQFKMHITHKLQNAEKIKERFEKVLQKYEIEDFRVEIDDFTTHIINVGYKTIGVGSAIKRYECNVDRLIVHEIETHVLQTYNIKNSHNPLFDFSKYGSQNLYGEGLAVYNEITTRKITPSAFETYYFRIKAVKLLNKSFREIFEILSEDLPVKKALVMTYRVKRGMADTSKPGGFPKDAAYLLGFHEIETILNEGYSKKLLYATKSPILTKLLLKYNLLDTKNIIKPKFI